jgi:hypothetical protein
MLFYLSPAGMSYQKQRLVNKMPLQNLAKTMKKITDILDYPVLLELLLQLGLQP